MFRRKRGVRHESNLLCLAGADPRKQLREKLAELGLPSRGRKAELLEQLRLAVLRAEEEFDGASDPSDRSSLRGWKQMCP